MVAFDSISDKAATICSAKVNYSLCGCASQGKGHGYVDCTLVLLMLRSRFIMQY